MASPQGAQSVVCDNFLGVVTNCANEALPEGASPMAWDVDFITGDVFTRPGLQTKYNTALGWEQGWEMSWEMN